MTETETGEFSIPDLPDWLRKQLQSPGVHPEGEKAIFDRSTCFEEVTYADQRPNGVSVANFSLESHGRGRGRPYLLAVICEHLYGSDRSVDRHGHLREAEDIHGHIYALDEKQIRHLVDWLQKWLEYYMAPDGPYRRSE